MYNIHIRDNHFLQVKLTYYFHILLCPLSRTSCRRWHGNPQQKQRAVDPQHDKDGNDDAHKHDGVKEDLRPLEK